MIIYFVALGIVILSSLIINVAFSKNQEKLKKIIFSIIVFITLFCIMGMRDKTVGIDTQLYCKIFMNKVEFNIRDSSFNTARVYEFYNTLVGILLGHSSRSIIIANSFVIILLFIIFNNKSSPNIYISTIIYILSYFYLQGFNIARQFIAILLSAIAMDYVVKKDFLKFLIFSLLAIFTHNTAIIIFIVGLVLIKTKEINIKMIIGLIIIAIIAILLLDKEISIFVTIFPKYATYFTTNDIFYETGQGRKLLLIMFYAFYLFVGLFLANKRKNSMDEIEYRKFMIYTGLIILSCIVGIFGTTKSILISRISLYFEIFVVIYIPLVIENIKKRKEIWYFFTILILFIPFYIQLSGNISGVVPYQFFK